MKTLPSKSLRHHKDFESCLVSYLAVRGALFARVREEHAYSNKDAGEYFRWAVLLGLSMWNTTHKRSREVYEILTNPVEREYIIGLRSSVRNAHDEMDQYIAMWEGFTGSACHVRKRSFRKKKNIDKAGIRSLIQNQSAEYLMKGNAMIELERLPASELFDIMSGVDRMFVKRVMDHEIVTHPKTYTVTPQEFLDVMKEWGCK